MTVAVGASMWLILVSPQTGQGNHGACMFPLEISGLEGTSSRARVRGMPCLP